MAVLVTGGAGYIGSHMVWELIDAGEDVVVLDRLSTGHDWAVAPQAKLVVGDIGDRELVAAVILEHDVDAIIHFAGSILVPESVTDPLGYYENNTGNTGSLLDAAIGSGVKHFIFSSTAAVYGSAGDEAATEDASLNPQSPYGRSKLMSEWMLADAAAAHDLKYTILRYFNVAGADPQGRAGQSTKNATHLIKVACETALGKRPHIDVYGTDYDTADGTCVRDYIHVSDLVHAHRLALDRLRQGGGNLIANCGYGHGYSVLEVLQSVKRLQHKDFETRLAKRRPGDPASIVSNPELAKRELNWTPQFDDLDIIISTAIKWEQGLMMRGNME